MPGSRRADRVRAGRLPVLRQSGLCRPAGDFRVLPSDEALSREIAEGCEEAQILQRMREQEMCHADRGRRRKGVRRRHHGARRAGDGDVVVNGNARPQGPGLTGL